MKKSSRQKRCGYPLLKHHGYEPPRLEMPAAPYHFISATLPSLEMRLAAIHAKIFGNSPC